MQKIYIKIKAIWRFRRLRLPDTLGLVVTLLLAIFAATVPFWARGYLLFQLSTVCVYAIALSGLNLLTGYNGQLSVGHGAVYGVGSFAMGILMTQLHLPYYFSLPIVALISGALGLAFGIPSLRLENISLALATFSLAVALPQIFEHFDGLTGGTTGLEVSKPSIPSVLLHLGFNYDQWIYSLSYLILAACLFMISNLNASSQGRAIWAVHDNDISAGAMGVDVNSTKVKCFVLSCMITGIAGALSTLLLGHVAPETFNVGLSITFLTGIVIGGLGSLMGPIYGAIFIEYLPNYTDGISKALTSAVYGGVLILFMYFDPKGISGAIDSVRRRSKDIWSYLRI